MYNKIRYVGGFLTSLIAVLAISPVVAQTTDNDEDQSGALEEVIVTAQRREQNIQDTPVTMNALNADMLRNLDVKNITDLSAKVPALQVGGFGTGGGNNPIAIRGVSGQLVLVGADSAVAVYLDGVYLSKPDAAFFSLGDVERVEVLRGPQGTLYGRNSTAGAINIITMTPGDTWNGFVDANIGNYDSYQATGFAGGPLGENWSTSFSFAANSHDGYFINTATGNPVNGQDQSTGRWKLRYVSDSGNFDANLAADYTRQTGNISTFNYGTAPAATYEFLGVSNPGKRYVEWEDYLSDRHISKGVGLVMNYRPNDNLTLTSVSGVRRLTVDARYSITPEGGFPLLGGRVIHSLNGSDYGPTIMQELRAVYASGPLTVTGGLTYFQEDVYSQFGGIVTTADAPPPPNALDSVPTAPQVNTDTESFALFTQVEWEFADRLTGIFGLRWNHESRKMVEDFVALPGQPQLKSDISDDAFMPKFGLTYAAKDNVFYYGTISKGYQAPGQSPQTGASLSILEFTPETIWAYEAGVKTDLMDGRLRLNAAAFYYDYTDLQVRVTAGLNDFRIVNADAEIYGFELESTAALTDNVVVYANLSYNHNEYTKFCDAAVPFDQPLDCALPGSAAGTKNGVDRTGNSLNYAPEWTGSLGINVKQPLSNDMVLSFDGNYTYQGDMFFAPANLKYVEGKGIGQINLRAALQVNDKVEVYVFGKNLSNQRVQTSVIYTALVGEILNAGAINAPKTWGIGFRYNF